jgi:hypothetical protein
LTEKESEKMEDIYSLLAVLILAMTLMGAVKRNFTPSENGGNPIHWFRVKVGEVCRVDLSSITFGVLADFHDDLELAVPKNDDDWRERIAALVMAHNDVIQPDGHGWKQALWTQSAAVNDLMDFAMKNGRLVKGPKWGDTYEMTSKDAGHPASILVRHDKTEHGNRSRYSVREAVE